MPNSKWNEADLSNHNFAIVFFDLETGGLHISCDILQIAMKCELRKFSKYVTPTQPIDYGATEVNHLSNKCGQLHYRNRPVQSAPIDKVLQELLEFLQGCQKPCILVAHNCAFDAPRLMKAIRNASLVDEFRGIVAGFADTLPMLKKKLVGRKGFRLTSLAATLSLSTANAHDANHDVFLLESVTQHYFSIEEVTSSQKSFADVLQEQVGKEQCEIFLPTFNPLVGKLSQNMRERLAKAGLSYKKLLETFRAHGEEVTTELLRKVVDGKPTVIKTKYILTVILNHLESKVNNTK